MFVKHGKRETENSCLTFISVGEWSSLLPVSLSNYVRSLKVPFSGIDLNYLLLTRLRPLRMMSVECFLTPCSDYWLPKFVVQDMNTGLHHR